MNESADETNTSTTSKMTRLFHAPSAKGVLGVVIAGVVGVMVGKALNQSTPIETN